MNSNIDGFLICFREIILVNCFADAGSSVKN